MKTLLALAVAGPENQWDNWMANEPPVSHMIEIKVDAMKLRFQVDTKDLKHAEQNLLSCAQ